MKYQAYPEYKPTHLGWLNQIPNHWEVKRLKYLGEAIIGLTYSPDEVVNEGEGVLVLRSSNVQDKQLAFDDNVYVNKSIPEKLVVKKGDILICARNGSRALIGKNAQIDEHSAGMTFGAFMSIFRSSFNDYLAKVFNSALFEYQSGSFLTATINQLTTGNLNSFEIPLPSISEQTKIANFLDYETAKIDTLIEKQQQLIKLLKEKRQAVISHAVTKGLNPDVPMRDSGVEWLGEVPEHWEVKAMKYAVILQRGHDLPSDNRVGGEIPIVSSGGFIGYHCEAVTTGPTIVTGRYGTIGEFVYVEENCWPLNTSLYAVNMYDNLPKFLWYMLQAYKEHFVLNSLKAAVPGVDRNDIHPIKITIPNIEEQTGITIFLDNKTAKLDFLISKASSAIILMQERRTALISAAVTGKIDVRNYPATGV